jgi:hypothetical protein
VILSLSPVARILARGLTLGGLSLKMEAMNPPSNIPGFQCFMLFTFIARAHVAFVFG